MIDGDKGGMWDTTSVGGGSWAIFYVQVDDVKTAIDKATGLGATVVVPFTDSGPLEFAHLQDPQGNRFGVWHPKVWPPPFLRSIARPNSATATGSWPDRDCVLPLPIRLSSSQELDGTSARQCRCGPAAHVYVSIVGTAGVCSSDY